MSKFESFRLFEMKKRQLLSQAHKKRRLRINEVSLQYDGAYLEDGIINIAFKTTTSKKGTTYNQLIQILDVNNKIDKNNLLKSLKGNLKVDCSCPDYLYKGFKYIGTVKDYAIEDEDIKPIETNPELKGSVCKHLLAILINIEKYVPQILEDL